MRTEKTPQGMATTYATLEKHTRIASALAGPVAGAAAGALVIALGAYSNLLWLEGTGALLCSLELVNLVPHRRGRHRSDGAVIIDTLRSERLPTIDDAVSRHAFAGWCWRAVSGDAWREMRDAALDAIHAATRAGAVEPDLTIVAARSLAALESATGLMRLPIDLRSIPVEPARQQWAFQFGVALYDIERARAQSARNSRSVA